MHVEINVDQLRRALTALNEVVERHAKNPILKHVLIQTRVHSVEITGTDLDMWLTLSIPADVLTPGSAALSLASLRDALIGEGAAAMCTLTAADDTGETLCRVGASRYVIPSLPVGDFLKVPGKTASHEFDMHADRLRDVLDRVKHAVSRDETRYYLRGVYVHGDNGRLAAVTTDGHRLARIKSDLPGGAAGMPGIIIPEKTMSVVSKALKKQQSVHVEVSPRVIKFTWGRGHLYSKLVDGTFPGYKRVFPRDRPDPVTIRRADLLQILKRAKKSRVTLSAEVGKLLIKCAEFSTEIAANYFSDPREATMNPVYLADAISAVAGEYANIELDPTGPDRITGNADDAEFLVMPVGKL